MCVIYTDVRHNEICEESRQCTYSEDTECRNNKCQCGNKREYKEGQCVLREVGMYENVSVDL